MDGIFAEGTTPGKMKVHEKTIMIEGKSFKLQIDRMGESSTYKLCGGPGPYTGYAGVIIMYDVTNQASFSNVKQWIEETERYAPSEIRRFLVGNKSEMTTRQVVDFDTAKKFADERNLPLLEISVKTSFNVEESFTLLTTEIHHEREIAKDHPGQGLCDTNFSCPSRQKKEREEREVQNAVNDQARQIKPVPKVTEKAATTHFLPQMSVRM